MTHAGYFEGIGGFSLGAENCNINTIYTCELDDYRNTWLQYRFPNAIHDRDIRTTDGIYADVFTGGFPCQDISLANPKGKGLEGKRSGLWWEFYRIISIHRPRFVVLENSPNLINKGLLDILTAFAKIGYDAEWQIISKRAVGFQDERERFFLVAYPHQIGRNHYQQVFSKKYFEVCRKEVEQSVKLQSKTFRIRDEDSLREAHAYSVAVDTGLPAKLAKNEIEAYGDAVCPAVAQLVLMMIKRFNEQ